MTTGGHNRPVMETWILDFDPARASAADLAARRARTRVVGQLALALFDMPGRLLTAIGSAVAIGRWHRRA